MFSLQFSQLSVNVGDPVQFRKQIFGYNLVFTGSETELVTEVKVKLWIARILSGYKQDLVNIQQFSVSHLAFMRWKSVAPLILWPTVGSRLTSRLLRCSSKCTDKHVISSYQVSLICNWALTSLSYLKKTNIC